MVSITPKQGLKLIFLCVLFDGTAGMFIKLLPWNPFVIAGLRGGLAFLLLFCYYKSQGIQIVVNHRSVLAGCMISAMFFTFVAANQLTMASNVVALQFSNPVYIVLITALLFRQKPLKREVLTVLGVLIGILLIFSGSVTPGVSQAQYPMLGNILAAISGLCLAGMLIFNNRVKDPREHFSALLLGQLITFLVSIYFIFTNPPVFSATAVLAILSLGILQQAVPNILYSYAIRVLKPLLCSLIMMLNLVINPVLVFFALGEIPGMLEILGSAVILCVSVTAIVTSSKQEAQ